MKPFWILLPLVLLSIKGSADNHLFYASEQDCDWTTHMDLEHESGESLSLLEIDEHDPSLIPWSSDELSLDSPPLCPEEESEEFDEPLSYAMPGRSGKTHYEPTHESIPAGKRQFFNRPRVIQAKEKKSVADEDKKLQAKREKAVKNDQPK